MNRVKGSKGGDGTAKDELSPERTTSTLAETRINVNAKKGASGSAASGLGYTLNKQELLLKILKGKAKSADSRISRADREKLLPLSWAQQRLWLLSQLDSEAGRAYHVPIVLRMKGGLDKDALTKAFATVLERHEILRTNIQTNEQGRPFQHIQGQSACYIESHTLSDKLSSSRRLNAYKSMINEIVSAPFDLAADSLIRAGLIKLADDDHCFVIVMHHIVTDGWSIGILAKELSTLYGAFVHGQPNPLNKLTIQYADYAVWQRNLLQDDVLDKESRYWRGRLQNVQPIKLPIGRPRPPTPSYRGAWSDISIDAELSLNLKSFGKRYGCTVFMTLLAVFKVLLHRYSQQTDICVGTPVANRLRSDIEPLIGFFVNTLALRTEVHNKQPFSDLLMQVKATTLSAYDHQTMPFERVVEVVKPERNRAFSPLFQVMLVLQNAQKSASAMPGLTVKWERTELRSSKLDLTLDLQETEEGALEGGIEYSTDLFDESTIGRFKQHFINLIRSIIVSPDKALCDLEFLTEQEKYQLLSEWNGRPAPYSREIFIDGLFETRVRSAPDSMAVIFDDQQLTYGELNIKANQLARYLIENGVKPNTLVGICVERSAEMIVSILGVMKAGGAYVPLDPNLPSVRLQHMIEDANLNIILTQSHLYHQTKFHEIKTLCLDDTHVISEINVYSKENISAQKPRLTFSHPAYVIYTSGSTGKPKGVVVEHGAIANHLLSVSSIYKLGRHDNVLQFASFNFDASIEQILAPLVSGSSLTVIKNQIIDAPLLVEYVRSKQVTVVDLPPAVLDNICHEDSLATGFRRVRLIISGGDALKPMVARRILNALPSVKLMNAYGPTEAVITTSLFQVPAAFERQEISRTISIGKVIGGRECYILGDNSSLVPVGVPGELHIGGEGLARGYLNLPELTAEKFVTNPFSDAPKGRLYKTGDLCRHLPDGNIEFLGRIDNQVKVRGFRIELGEIENILIGHVAIKNAVVLARGDEAGDKCLVAYLVCETDPVVGELREYLGRSLPNYMVPSAFVSLPEFPLTPNGKINKKALEALDLAQLDVGIEYVAPRSEVEHQLAAIWSRVLNRPIDMIGVHHNFFDLGGHSLLLLQVSHLIAQNFLLEDSNRNFVRDTIEDQARLIEKLCDRDLNQAKRKPDCLSIRDISKRYDIPGVAYAYFDGEKIAIGAYGTASVDKAKRGSQLRFSVYCLSKTLVSMLVLKLHDIGLLDLNSVISAHIKDLNLQNPLFYKLTILQLLTHKSGLDDSDMSCLFSDAHSVNDAAERLNNSSFSFEPGGLYGYSSLGFILLAYIVEQTTGMSWRDALDKFVFTELDIDIYDMKGEKAESDADVDIDEPTRLLPHTEYLEPASGHHLSLTAEELCKIAVVALKRGVEISGRRFLSDQIGRLLTADLTRVEDHFAMKAWSVGWYRFSSELRGFISGAHGSHTCVAFSMERQEAIVLQTNTYPNIAYFNYVAEMVWNKKLICKNLGDAKSVTDHCLGSYVAAGIKIVVDKTEGNQYTISVSKKNSAGVWGSWQRSEIQEFHFGGLVAEGGVLAFLNRCSNGVPQFLRYGLYTLAKEIETNDVKGVVH